jgi:transposase
MMNEEDLYWDLGKWVYQTVKPRKLEKQKVISDYQPLKNKVKKTYSQDWKAYDLAKTNEQMLFKTLLTELLLLANLKEEREFVKGKKGYCLQDKIFCLAIRTYYGSSLRKTTSVLKDLKKSHEINKVPCYKTISNFLNDKRMGKVLDELITLTTIPLLGVEKVAAVDSSGFSISKYERWNNFKWGKTKGKSRVWRKAHIICGCLTNIIFSVKVSKGNQHDSPVFPILAKEATQYFKIEDIVADKAYGSKKNLLFAYELGMNAFIPFKKNAVTRNKGLLWRKMYKLFTQQPEQFYKKYHLRSNVETCFHVLKQRFGNNIKTKSFYPNAIEIKFKILCHNLCVLIQEYFERGIKTDFKKCVKTTQQVKKNN